MSTRYAPRHRPGVVHAYNVCGKFRQPGRFARSSVLIRSVRPLVTIKAMTYAAAVDALFARGGELSGTRRKFELEHMRLLAGALGDPQRRFPSVLIAGTNGKGSTAATLASILNCAGYCTGLYTSPHLLRVNERIQISRASADGQQSLTDIDDDTFARLYVRVDDAANALVHRGKLPQ